MINWCDTTHFNSEDDYHTGCRNISHYQQQEAYSGLRSPGWLYSTYLWDDSWVQTFHILHKCNTTTTTPVLLNQCRVQKILYSTLIYCDIYKNTIKYGENTGCPYWPLRVKKIGQLYFMTILDFFISVRKTGRWGCTLVAIAFIERWPL